MIKDQVTRPSTDPSDKFESSYFKMFIQNNILYCQYAPGLHISLSVARSSVEGRIFFSKGKSYPVLVDMKGVKSTSAEADQYLTDIGSTLVKASAMITESPVKQTVGNLMLLVNKPRVPTRLFTSEKKAKEWLMRYL